MQNFYTASATSPKGGLILLHEAFGLTPHIRSQVDAFAARGYTTYAPDMLVPAAPLSERNSDPWQTDGQYSWLTQNKAGLDLGRATIPTIKPEQIFPILQQAMAFLKKPHINEGLPVATIGYCWGGSVSFVAAKQLPGLACAACYYGGRIAELAAMPPAPRVPVIAHLAKLDRYIPFDDAMKSIQTHTPQVEAYGYDADHGFNRDDGPVYDAEVATLALQRTLAFFNKHLK